jgi:hypothetical protein
MAKYFTGKPCKRGHVAERYSSSGVCVECARIWERENRQKRTDQRRELYAQDPETHRAQSARWKADNPEKVREMANDWGHRNPDKKRAARLRRKEKANAYRREWIKHRPELTRSQAARRRAALLQRTVLGHDEELRRIYAECPDGHEVDHIVPLQAPDVCGLHVPWNLQYLPMRENRAKGNRHAHSTA